VLFQLPGLQDGSGADIRRYEVLGHSDAQTVSREPSLGVRLLGEFPQRRTHVPTIQRLAVDYAAAVLHRHEQRATLDAGGIEPDAQYIGAGSKSL
jgi:hypothetical protein